MKMRWTKWFLVAGLGVVAVLLAMELLLRVVAKPQPADSLHRALPGKPWLYGLNPDHPEVGTDGLRGVALSLVKPKGERRILVLGGSVVYGVGQPQDTTISAYLQQMFKSSGEPDVKVINAGVHGWSPWNGLRWYREQGRRIDADVVVVVLCLNDVVNPHLHWSYTPDAALAIPDDAVPNLEDHRRRVVPKLAAMLEEQQAMARFPYSLLRRSKLYRSLTALLSDGVGAEVRNTEGAWSTRVSGEDDVSMEVWMDPDSPEWTWLRTQLVGLRDAIAAEGAELLLVSVPLATQLDPGQPIAPRDRIAIEAKALGIDYISTLDSLRDGEMGGYFLGEISGEVDIWHLGPNGVSEVVMAIGGHLRDVVLPRATDR